MRRLGAQPELRLVLISATGITTGATAAAPSPVRSLRPVPRLAPVWVVAGAPGAGKSTVADLLTAALEHAGRPPAVLDKDTLFSGFVAEVQAAHGREPGEREGPWYDAHVKAHEYRGMTAAAAQIRAGGCPVLLVGPFTEQIRDADRWQAWTRDLGGQPVHLWWVRVDADTLHRRLVARGSDRDAGKLATFDAFLARMRPDEPPPAPHLVLDNRAGAPPLADQVRMLLDRV